MPQSDYLLSVSVISRGTTVVQNYSKRMKLAIGGWSVMLTNMY